MKKEIETATFYATFPFPEKMTVGETTFHLWEYFVEIEARDRQESERIAKVNFPNIDRIYTAEAFAGRSRNYKGKLTTLYFQREKYFVLDPFVGFYGFTCGDWTLPHDWKKFVLMEGSPEDCAAAINEERVPDMSIITEGERILLEWLSSRKWIPQKF